MGDPKYPNQELREVVYVISPVRFFAEGLSPTLHFFLRPRAAYAPHFVPNTESVAKCS